eukprot:snap_masked-scaffold229_size244821-processed-gene-0.0 protein:Tk01400 transcript:snap_masked-scaffold229_size244821-processed-gene-0.0-mRNA-1 annotation:"hypothetical protein DAPPUDRAFT_310892"
MRPKVGEEIRDWRVHHTREVSEFELKATELRHLHSGAKFLSLTPLQPSEDIHAFSVNFKTTPMDSSGISHILEHVSLCGSHKYPVRDPFFKMLNRSLSSFMNAMTGPDYTLYPYSTQNETDFFNLLSVYLDAVFQPRLQERDFHQEGWRLEHENLDDPQSPIVIKGVVFNEMKGVYADSQQLFNRQLLNSVLPSHTYGNCSGGLPEKIPTLTWDNLKQFHQRHYNPHNTRFLSYGSLPLERQLEAVNEYLPKSPESGYEGKQLSVQFGRIDPDTFLTVPLVPNEPKWSSPKEEHIYCAPDPTAPDASTVAIAYLTCDIHDPFEAFILGILGDLLLDGANSAFYKSLLESGLGTSFAPSTGYDNHTKDTLFTVGLQGIDIKRKDEIVGVIKKTFEQVVEEGFDPDRIKAILHQTELALKNKSNSFGLNLIMGLTPLWNHSDDCPLDALEVNSKIDRFKLEMQKNPKFLENKVKAYFIDNPHHLVLSMSPQETFTKEQDRTLKELQDNLVQGLTESDKAQLLQDGKSLADAQNAKEDINILPTLSINDIKGTIPGFELEHLTLDRVPVQISRQPTNEVAFFRALISTQNLPKEQYESLGLLTMVLSSLGAGRFDFRRLDTEIDLRSGGLSSDFHLSEMPGNLQIFKQGLLLTSRCLERNVDNMFELWTEIFNDLHYNNPDRLKTLINMFATDTMNRLVYKGHSYAMGSSAASVQAGTSMRDQFGGLNHIRFLNNLAQKDSLDEVIENLRQVGQCLLRKDNMKIALNTTEKHSSAFLKSVENFVGTVPGEFQDFQLAKETDFEPFNKNEYITTPFPVHFCAQSVPIVPYAHPDFAPLRIMARLLSLKFLHTEIREKGGAYGGGASPGASGVFSFYSYRDPNSHKTLETFGRSHAWLQEKHFTQQDIDESKLGVFQKLDEPSVPGARGMREFLTDVDDKMFNEQRDRLKAVKMEDILRVGEQYLGNPQVRGTTIIGPEPKEALDSSWTKTSL